MACKLGLLLKTNGCFCQLVRVLMRGLVSGTRVAMAWYFAAAWLGAVLRGRQLRAPVQAIATITARTLQGAGSRLALRVVSRPTSTSCLLRQASRPCPSLRPRTVARPCSDRGRLLRIGVPSLSFAATVRDQSRVGSKLLPHPVSSSNPLETERRRCPVPELIQCLAGNITTVGNSRGPSSNYKPGRS